MTRKAKNSRTLGPVLAAALTAAIGGALAAAPAQAQDARLEQVEILQAERAVADAREALRGLTEDDAEWGAARQALGLALFQLASRTSDAGLAREAAGAFRTALEAGAGESPTDQAEIQARLGDTLLLAGLIESDPGALDEAAAFYRTAQEVQTRTGAPYEWAVAEMRRAIAAIHAADLAGDPAPLGNARAQLNAAHETFHALGAFWDAQAAQDNLAQLAAVRARIEG